MNLTLQTTSDRAIIRFSNCDYEIELMPLLPGNDPQIEFIAKFKLSRLSQVLTNYK
jgi:hypothetical protein